MSTSPFSTQQILESDEEIVSSNIDDSVFDEITEVSDPTADSDLSGRPPKHDLYLVKWELSDKGIVKAVDRKSKKGYLQAYIQGVIKDEGGEYDGYKVFIPSPLMSMIWGNRPTSTLHSFLHKIGHTVQKPLTVNQLKEYIEEVMNSKPTGKAELDWQTNIKTTNSKGDVIYKVVRKGMENYPFNEETGEFEHVTEDGANGEAVAAQVYVVKHILQ